MKLFGLIIFFWLFACCHSFGQVTISDLLKSALEDPRVSNYKAQISFLAEKEYRLPFLQKTEFRLQNNEVNPDKQQYGLRFTPSNPWKIKNNNQYFRTYQETLSIQKDLALRESLALRYQWLITYINLFELREMLGDQVKILESQINTLSSQKGTASFRADDYLALQVKYAERLSEKATAEKDLNNTYSQLNKFSYTGADAQLQWEPEGVVSVGQIRQMTSAGISAPEAPLAVQFSQHEMALAAQEYKLERSDNGIGFIQAEFDRNSQEEHRTPLNISLGITLPLFNAKKPDMAKKRLKEIEASYELQQVKKSQASALAVSDEKVSSLLTQYEALEDRVNTLSDEEIVKLLRTANGGNPLLQMEYLDKLLKLKTLLLQLRTDVWEAYIENLYLKDKLQERPLINYLSNDQFPLE